MQDKKTYTAGCRSVSVLANSQTKINAKLLCASEKITKIQVRPLVRIAKV